MLSNDIKSGMEIQLTHGREGWMRDNKRGITRVVEVVVPGQGTDVGSCYINEIISVKTENGWEAVEYTEAHQKQLAKLWW